MRRDDAKHRRAARKRRSADRQGARGLCPRAFPAKRRTPDRSLARGIVGRMAYPDKGICGSRSSQIRRSTGVHPLGDRCGRGALRSGRSLRPRAYLPCGPRRSEHATATRRVRAGTRPRPCCATPRAEAAAGLAGACAATSPGPASRRSGDDSHAGPAPGGTAADADTDVRSCCCCCCCCCCCYCSSAAAGARRRPAEAPAGRPDRSSLTAARLSCAGSALAHSRR